MWRVSLLLGGVLVAALLIVGGGASAAAAPTPSATTAPSPTASTGETPSASPSGSASTSTSGSPTPTTTGSPTGSPTTSPSASESESSAPTESPSPTESAPIEPTPSASASLTPAPDRRPATAPAVQSSGIPLGSILIAIGVLVLAALAVWAAYRRGRGASSGGRAGLPAHPRATATAPDVATPPGSREGVVGFLVALGEAMIDAGDPVTHVQVSLQRVAAVNGVGDAEIIVLPTALIVSVAGTEAGHTAGAAAGRVRLRLDQVDAVFDVVRSAESGEVDPAEGLARLRAARSMPPAFSPPLRLLGYVVLTVGLALVLQASWTDLVVASLLGAVVGGVLLAADRLSPTYQVFLPVVSAFGVSVAVFLLARTSLDLGIFAPLVAPLVTFLPGALLTTSVIELSTGQMISGAGRLAAGAMQLVLLALGISAGAQLVGVPATSVTDVAADPLSTLGPWVGVAVFGLGVLMHNSARRSSFGWIVMVLYVAYAGQVVGGLLLGGVLSAFAGALVATPAALFAAEQRSGPPTLVTFLPAFWLLVPGALSLVGVTKLLGADRVDAVSSLVTAGATMVAIALGVLLGLAVGGMLAGGVTRFGGASRV